jgi:hypothetical protein
MERFATTHEVAFDGVLPRAVREEGRWKPLLLDVRIEQQAATLRGKGSKALRRLSALLGEITR